MVWMEILRMVGADRGRTVSTDPTRQNVLSGITIGIAAAILISLTHLGSPIKSVLTLNNLATSWLSREILLVILFAGGVVLGTVLQWRGWGSETTRNIVNTVSALLGLALVYSMARVYMLPTTPGWNSIATPVSFYATSLVLGGSVLLAVLARTRRESQSQGATLVTGEHPIRMLVFALALCLAVEIALTPFLVGIVLEHPLFGQADGITALNLVLAVRVLIVAAALGFLLRLLLKTPAQPKRWVFVAIVLVTVAEVLGRYTFYASYYRIGV
jgi:anaerobic dimethyl sulfoxide reductase subunit C (anchor subunit)